MKKTWIAIAAIFGLSPLAFPHCPVESPVEPSIGGPLGGLSPKELDRFESGEKVFERTFVPEDGLGPLFNGASCGSCHAEPVDAGSGAMTEIHATRFAPPGDCDPLFEEGGPVIQQSATPLLQKFSVEKETDPPSATGRALRTTPALFGLGLVDAIAEKTILALEDPADADGDGISGRANRFIDGRVGRFGRKAFVPSLIDFTAGAFPVEQGLTTPRSPAEETINGRPVPPDSDPAHDPEISSDEIELANDYVRLLAPPAPAKSRDHRERRKLSQGARIFSRISCAGCHVPEMTTDRSDVLALAHKRVALYSDLLLHDMGPDLADICLGLADPSEFRTEMLMGLRFRKRFLHDGSARTIEEAIERHGGEAERSRNAFEALTPEERATLMKFLGSI